MAWGTAISAEAAVLNRQHNLLVDVSKHFYLTPVDTVRHQKKELTRSEPGKRLLTRVLLLDVGSGAIYGEYHPVSAIPNMGEFLVRAWHPKRGHFLRGVPGCLLAPKKILETPKLQRQVAAVASACGVPVGPLPGGFEGGVHALRQFEDAMTSALDGHRKVTLDTVQGISSMCSAAAAPKATLFSAQFNQARAVPQDVIAAVEARAGTAHWYARPFFMAFPPDLVASVAGGTSPTNDVLLQPPGT